MRFQYEPFGAPKIFKNTLGIGHWIGGLDAPKKFRIVACEDIRVCFQCFLPFGDFESFFFCVLLFFITIICAPCFFGVFFLGGGGFGFKQNKIRWCIFSLFEWNPTGWVKIFVENLRSTPSPALGFLRTFEVCNKSFQSRRIVPLADGWWWKKTYRYRYGYLLKQGLCGYARSFVL